MSARCPECDAEITLNHSVVVCEVIRCPECASELEVIAVDPLELALAPEVEEDWGE
jgi:alpha-aminoadipate carrier protein LysW